MTQRQVKRRGPDQFALFRDGHGYGRTGERTAAAFPDLDKHEHRAVAHDEINFANAAVKVSFHEFETVRLEE